MVLKDTLEDNHYVAKLIESHGYSAEIHDGIVTEDNYLLTLYRIPRAKVNISSDARPVVLLMHGFACSSLDYVITGPEKGLGFLLSERGYDVWMINGRGSSVSRKHAQYNADEHHQYWRFSFHEMGIYDLPAVLKHIEKITTQQSVIYIGYSMGTLLPLILLSEKPEYNKKFNLVIEIAPAAVMTNLRSYPYKILFSTRHLWMAAMEKSGKLEFFPTWAKNCIAFLNRQYSGIFHSCVIQFLQFIHGNSVQDFVMGIIPVIFNHYPESTSVIVLKHAFQIYGTGCFRKLDLGHCRNLEEYGTPHPPVYDLAKVVCPCALFSSSNDLVSHPKDVRALSKQLPNCIAVHELENPKFNHSDFLYGAEASKAMYPYIFEHLKNYAKAK